MEISRREFLKYLGITTAGYSLASIGCDTIWSVPDEVYEKVGGLPRIETWKNSVCSLCPGGCGIKVRLIDGIPVRIQGNPIHPINRGGICPMAEAGIEALFNPDRIKQPMKRIGERGQNQWESISWEEAMQIVVSRLQELRNKGETHKLGLFTGEGNNLLSTLLERFMQAFGSPNLYSFNDDKLPLLVNYLTMGQKKQFGYNFKDIEFLINFGADSLDVGPSPIRFNQIYSEMRNRKNGRSARIIHVDSRLSRTAGNSSEWVPIRPGTMAALALGIANVLIKDKQYDQSFVSSNSFGFDDWKDSAGNSHQGFKSLVRRDFSPEKVAELTGVPPSKIVELAREFGIAEHALVLAGGQAVNSNNGLYTVWAIECLNALKGNFTRDSAISMPEVPPFADMPEVNFDENARNGLSNPLLTESLEGFCFPEQAVSNLPKVFMEKQPYPLDVLLVGSVNPIFNSTNQSDFIKALNEIPFIVSFSPFLDETASYADLILPDHVFLEKHEVLHSIPMVEVSHLGMQQPVVEPLYDSRHSGDVILQIADTLGGTVASSFPWSDYKEYIQSRLEGVYQAGAGTIFTERMDEAWLKFLKDRGWQIFDYTTFEEFWDVLLENGGWWNPFPSNTDFREMFKTPSKKFEFHSQILEKAIKSKLNGKNPATQDLTLLLENWHIEARGDLVFLPHYEEPKFDDSGDQYNLHLLSYNLITNVNGAGSNLPLIQELFGLLTRNYWESWVEINPETAFKHGINEGDMVKVTSPKGSLQVKARLLPGIMPDILYIPFGLGHKAYGRYAKGVGVNPHEIIYENFDYLSGCASRISTKIFVENVNGKEGV